MSAPSQDFTRAGQGALLSTRTTPGDDHPERACQTYLAHGVSIPAVSAPGTAGPPSRRQRFHDAHGDLIVFAVAVAVFFVNADIALMRSGWL